jgi:hypothetical protein
MGDYSLSLYLRDMKQADVIIEKMSIPSLAKECMTQ